MKEKVLDAMKSAGKPVGVSDIVKLTNLERDAVEKAFAELKKQDLIFSPVRCKWQPK